MGMLGYASRHRFSWAAAALFMAVPAIAQARDWWVMEPDGTCQAPHVYASPADQIKTLTREGNPVQVKKINFPDGSFALTLTFSGGKNLWVTSEQTCNFIIAALKPKMLDTDWNDFQ